LPTLRTTESLLPLFIPTLLRLKPAKSKEDHSKFQVFKLSKDAPTSKMQSKADPSVSQLMLPTGSDTPQEFSTTAAETLTMPSSSLVLPQPTSRSRTPGEPHGERKVSSDWLLEIPAVFATTSHLGSNDHQTIIDNHIY